MTTEGIDPMGLEAPAFEFAFKGRHYRSSPPEPRPADAVWPRRRSIKCIPTVSPSPGDDLVERLEGLEEMTEHVGYSDEVLAEASDYPGLGPEYFAAREVAERFLKDWREQHAEELAEAIMKPVLDAVTEKVWDTFRDHLLSDAALNAQTEMQHMVENSVRALIGGHKWANVKYIQTQYGDGQKVRETLAKLYSDEIKDGRIADLEEEVARLTEALRLREGRF